MNARTLVLAAAALVLPVVAAQAAEAGPTLTGFETRVTQDIGNQYDPAIAGNLVVFTDDRAGDLDVYYVDLSTMQEHPVIVAADDQELTGVSDGVVVYTDYSSVDVLAFDTATGIRTNLTLADKASGGFDSIDPAVSHGLVAWEDDRNGNPQIYAKLLSTGEERQVTSLTDVVDERPAVSGSLIVWERCPLLGGDCDIWMYDWTSGTTTQITATADGDERHPSIDGRHIVYQATRGGEQDVYFFDLDSGHEAQLSLPGEQANPHISGEFVALDDLSEGVYHIKLWHYPSNSVFQITSGTSGQYLNDIDGNRVVYTDDRNGDLDIYMYTFTATFPPPTPTEVCRSFTLAATRDYHPDRWTDGAQIFAPAMQFAIPAQIDVTSGSAANRPAMLGFGRSWSAVWCQYKGSGRSGHSSSATYLFDYCSDGSTAGALVTADQAWLHLNGDNKAGETSAQVTLTEVSPCVGAIPSDCDHLDGAAPILDTTLEALSQHHHHCGGGGGAGGGGGDRSGFLATPMHALVCIDNGPGGTAVTSGTLELDATQLWGPAGWQPKIETHADLLQYNVLRADVLAPAGSDVRVRVFAGPANAAPIPPPTKGHNGSGKGGGESRLWEGAGSESANGCSQAGPGLAPLAVLALILFALVPRRALALARVRRR